MQRINVEVIHAEIYFCIFIRSLIFWHCMIRYQLYIYLYDGYNSLVSSDKFGIDTSEEIKLRPKEVRV